MESSAKRSAEDIEYDERAHGDKKPKIADAAAAGDFNQDAADTAQPASEPATAAASTKPVPRSGAYLVWATFCGDGTITFSRHSKADHTETQTVVKLLVYENSVISSTDARPTCAKQKTVTGVVGPCTLRLRVDVASCGALTFSNGEIKSNPTRSREVCRSSGSFRYLPKHFGDRVLSDGLDDLLSKFDDLNCEKYSVAVASAGRVIDGEEEKDMPEAFKVVSENVISQLRRLTQLCPGMPGSLAGAMTRLIDEFKATAGVAVPRTNEPPLAHLTHLPTSSYDVVALLFRKVRCIVADADSASRQREPTVRAGGQATRPTHQRDDAQAPEAVRGEPRFAVQGEERRDAQRRREGRGGGRAVGRRDRGPLARGAGGGRGERPRVAEVVAARPAAAVGARETDSEGSRWCGSFQRLGRYTAKPPRRPVSGGRSTSRPAAGDLCPA